MTTNFISPAVPQSYADQQNSQYNHSGSKYVDLKQRFNDTISTLQSMKSSGVRSQLKNAIAVFQKNNPLVNFSSVGQNHKHLYHTPNCDSAYDGQEEQAR